MSRSQVIVISVISFLMTLMIPPLSVVRADGGYWWPNELAMRLHYAGMVKPIDGIPNYNGTLMDPYTMLWTDRYNCRWTPQQPWCCGLGQDGEGTGGHPGVDISATTGTPVRAVGEGRVIFSGFDPNWGNLIIVFHKAVPDAQSYGRFQGVTSIYAHLNERIGDARNGDGHTKVIRGTIIGRVGATGRASGSHLHFQIDCDDNATPFWPDNGVCNQASVAQVQNATFSPMRFVQAHEVRQISATGYYYSGTNFETYRGARNDPAIDFEWFNGAPGVSGVGTDNFSVRWYGNIFVPSPGWYAFFATADDGVRVWVDGSLIIDKWQDQPPYTYQAIRYLNVGAHSVRVDYYERGGGATIKVAWKPVSRILLSTGWENGQILGYSDRIQYRANVAGWYGNESPPPECSRRQEIRRSGSWAEMIAGRDMSSSQNSYCYYRVFEDNIEIREGTMIAFWIYHDTSLGADVTATKHVSVDGATTDGLTLRDFDNGAGWRITDQWGVRTHPALRNDPINQWYYVEVDLTPMAGRILDYIMFAYDDNAFSETGRYRAYVDDFYVFWP